MTVPSPAPGGLFPATRSSVLATLRTGAPAERRRALDTVAAAYRRPLVEYLRVRWSLPPAAAEDLVQELFVAALENDLLGRWDPDKARFRTYLRLCADGLAGHRREADRRLKRGGGWRRQPGDLRAPEGAVAELPAAGPDPEAVYHRERVRQVFSLALERTRRRLEGSGRALTWTVFERCDLEGTDAPRRPTYAELAAELGIAVTRVTNLLAAARRELRQQVLGLLRELTASDRELAEEARALLGRVPP